MQRPVVETREMETSVEDSESEGRFDDIRRMLGDASWERAEASLKLEIALSPLNPAAWNLLGALYEMQGKRLTALRLYRGSLSVDPAYRPATANLRRATRWFYRLDGIDLGTPRTLRHH